MKRLDRSYIVVPYEGAELLVADLGVDEGDRALGDEGQLGGAAVALDGDLQRLAGEVAVATGERGVGGSEVVERVGDGGEVALVAGDPGALGVDEDAKNRWYRHWVETGLETVERQLAAVPSIYCGGDRPGLADCVLVPQIFNAQRFECRLDHVPQVMRVFEACMKLDAFEATRPEKCPDAG